MTARQIKKIEKIAGMIEALQHELQLSLKYNNSKVVERLGNAKSEIIRALKAATE